MPPLHLLEQILGLLNTLKLDRKISPENADFRDALELCYELLARTDIAQRAKNQSGYRFPQAQNHEIDALKINAGAIIKNNTLKQNTMKTMYTNSGEKVKVTEEKRNLGHGAQVKVIYSDGSEGWEHIEDLRE